MSYRRRHRHGLGDVTAADMVRATTQVVLDPCFKQTAKLALELREVYKSESASTPSVPTVPTVPTTSSPGIGLCKIVGPLEFYVNLRKQGAWVIPAVGVGAVAAIFALGYWSGKGRR